MHKLITIFILGLCIMEANTSTKMLRRVYYNQGDNACHHLAKDNIKINFFFENFRNQTLEIVNNSICKTWCITNAMAFGNLSQIAFVSKDQYNPIQVVFKQEIIRRQLFDQILAIDALIQPFPIMKFNQINFVCQFIQLEQAYHFGPFLNSMTPEVKMFCKEERKLLNLVKQ